MAVVVASRLVVGRASSTVAAFAAIPSSLRSLSELALPPPATRALLRLIRTCNVVSSWKETTWGEFPSSLSSSVSAFSSSSSISSVESIDVPQPSSSNGEDLTSSSTAPSVEVDALDIRVGLVLKAWKHPEADSLYVEEVDLAEPDGPRTICSGLVNYLSLEELEGRTVLVLANLKARNMRGVKSNGMLLAASDAEHTTVQLLSPPEGALPGERVWFGDEAGQANQAPPGTPNQVQKKKIWESVQPLLQTREDCVATFQSKPMRTSLGFVTCKSLQGANIS